MELILGLLFSTILAVVFAVSRPPNMIAMSKKEIYYKVGEPTEIVCISSGEPRPIYSWEKNGRQFDPALNDDGIVQLANQGTIVFNRPVDRHEGIFQCYGRNNYGIAASVRYNMRMAVLNEFPTAPETVYRVQLGVGKTLNCNPPRSLPPAEVYWVLMDRLTGNYQVVNYDQRITMDYIGRLHITNVQPEDAYNDKVFVCSAMNAVLRETVQGPGYKIIPTGFTDTQIPTSVMWTSPTDSLVLQGEDFKLKCIFGGNPSPNVTWSRANGIMPASAITDSFGHELMILNIQPGDAGKYECSGDNILQQPVMRSFYVSVNSRPTWVNIPQDVEGEIDGTATFLCSAVGKPTPHIQWYINGKQVTEAVNSNMIVKGGNATFINLGENDSQVLQCNASNLYGYVWKNAYLNMMSRPTWVNLPQDVEAEIGGTATFLCSAVGNPTPSIQWHIKGKPVNEMVNPKMIVNGGIATFINLDQKDSLILQCNASNINGYVWKNAYLNVFENRTGLNANYATRQSISYFCTFVTFILIITLF